MPREADPQAKITRLQAAKRVFKRGQTCNLAELAAAVGDSARALKQRIDSDTAFPVEQRGNSGVGYVFNAHKALDHEIKRWKSVINERNAKMRRMADLAGIAVEDDDVVGLSLEDLRRIQSMQREAHKAKMDQGQYTRAEDVRRFLGDIFGAVQADYLGVRPALDSAGHWPPELAEKLENFMRTRLTRLHERIERLVNEGAGTTGGRA